MRVIQALIKREKDQFLFKPSETFMIYSIASAQSKIPGEYAEVGVYQGVSAEIICAVKGDKHLYLFDTFEGLPPVGELDPQFSAKMFKSNLAMVEQRMAAYKNVHIYPGLFPGTSEPVKNTRFAFVHLDVDLYQSTKDCLEFFYERMEPGGIILSHDYAQAAGVKQAFREFFQDKPEGIIELHMTQCMVVKR